MPEAPSAAARADDTTVAAVERLAAEFPALPRRTVCRVVKGCRADLSGVPVGALPELLERLARQRLTDSDAELPRRRTGGSSWVHPSSMSRSAPPMPRQLTDRTGAHTG